MSSRDSSPAELNRSITEMQKCDELYTNLVEEGCSARAHFNFISPCQVVFYFSALWNRQQMLQVVWLPKHYHFHITALLLCVTGIRKLWQHACMKHLNLFINVTVSYKNCMASIKLKILKSTLSLNSVPISYVRITKDPNYTKCKVHYIHLLI